MKMKMYSKNNGLRKNLRIQPNKWIKVSLCNKLTQIVLTSCSANLHKNNIKESVKLQLSATFLDTH